MDRTTLLNETRSVLMKAGFSTSDPSNLVHAGFDVVARRDQLIVIVKIIMNIDAIDKGTIASMVALARAVDGSPFVIGLKKSSSKVEDGVVYSRYGIPVLSGNTLHDLFLEGVPPMVYSAPGGFYVKINAEVLKKLRGSGLSLGELAEIAGVSRRTIQMYEEGMGAKLEIALRLEEHLGIELIVPIDPLSVSGAYKLDEEHIYNIETTQNELVKNVFERLNDMGYSVQPTNKCPFDALTSDRENLLFTGVGRLESQLRKKAKAMANISKLLDRYSVVFVEERKGKTSLAGSPLITSAELGRIEDKKKMLELIEDRG